MRVVLGSGVRCTWVGGSKSGPLRQRRSCTRFGKAACFCGQHPFDQLRSYALFTERRRRARTKRIAGNSIRMDRSGFVGILLLMGPCRAECVATSTGFRYSRRCAPAGELVKTSVPLGGEGLEGEGSSGPNPRDNRASIAPRDGKSLARGRAEANSRRSSDDSAPRSRRRRSDGFVKIMDQTRGIDGVRIMVW